jgi:phenylacetate-CoA ligase
VSAGQRQIYEMLLDSQYWMPARMQEFQRSQLSQLLVHAQRNVPFYRDRLAPIVRADRSIDWDRWLEIPVTTKDDLRDNGEDMISAVHPPGHGGFTRGFTSGSTGTPVSRLKNELFRNANRAAGLRMATWMEVDPTEAIIDFGRAGENAKREGHDHSVSSSLPGWYCEAPGPRVAAERIISLSRAFELLETYGIRRIHSVAIHLEILAAENLRRPRPLQMSGLLSYGMETTNDQRDLLRKSFGAETWCVYSTEEVGQVAAQHAPGGSYLINSELVLVEILDAGGKPCPPGVAGRVVMTPFFSSAQPLIRYAQGDFASFAEPSGCGRTLPTLNAIIGREQPILRFPGFEDRYPVFRHQLIAAALKCRNYQIAQIGPLALELRYVPLPGSAADHEEAIKLVGLTVPGAVTVTVRAMDEIPLRGNKPQRIVRDLT